MYEYDATVTKVYDGDTITVDFDLGLYVGLRKQTIRLYGIDTPEVQGEERPDGLVSRDWLRDQILDKKVKIETRKDGKGKFGRWLGIVKVKQENGEWLNLNDELVRLGLAEYRDY